MTTGIGITPDRIEATPGDPVAVVVEVTNHLAIPAQFQVRVIGSDTNWSGPPLVTPLLDPGASTSTQLTVTLPLGFPPGEHLLGVEAVPFTSGGNPSSDQHDRRVVDLVVSVGSLSGLHAVLEPRNVQGKQRGRAAGLNPMMLVRSRGSGIRKPRGGQAVVSLRNRSFEPIVVSLSAASPGDELDITFDQTEAVIPPGHIVPIRTKIKGARPMTGRVRRTPFTITAKGSGSLVHLEGNLARPARIRPGAMRGVAVLTVLAVWASTLFFVWDQVTTESEAEEATAEQAGDVIDATNGNGAGNGDGTNGEGTNGDGTNGDGPTDQQVGSRVQASGQVQAREPQGVQVRIRSVSLVDEISEGATFQTSMRGVNASGGMLFGRRGGVIHNRVVPAQVTTSTDEEGRWAASGIGGPGFYEIRFSKAGYATKAYVVEMPEDGSPISLDVELVAGDGGLSGVVSGPDGPLGDVEVTVTDGTVTLNTTTPTTGTVGAFGVDGLTTPGTYLVTASRRGYGTATELVRLSGGQSASGLQIRLRPGTGAITGTVRSSAGLLGDITITATNGDVVRSTTSLTEGPIGTFAITDLPMPDTYTLTVEGEGWMSQTRDVVLDSGQTDVGIEMVSSTGIIYGRLTNTAGQPIAGAGVTAVSEENTYKNTTAPDGTYEMVGLEPGSYVVEFEEFEYHTGSSLVTLGPGGLRQVDLSLHPRDNLEPEPNNSLTVTLSAPEVQGTISVRVTDRETGMFADAQVSGTTNAVFDNIPPGARTLDITGSGFQETTAIARVALNGANNISITLRPLVVPEVVVTNYNGNVLVEGATVTLARTVPACLPASTAPGCNPDFVAITNADGRALVPNSSGVPTAEIQLTDGTYEITAAHPDYVTRTRTTFINYETDPNPPVPMALNQLGVIRFDVVEPGGGQGLDPIVLDDYTVTVTPAFGEPGENVRSSGSTHPFDFTGLPTGTYTATLTKTGYDDVVVNGIAVSLNSVIEQHLVMFPSLTTSGRVMWADPDNPNGPSLPIEDAFVEITGITGYSRSGGGAPTAQNDTWNTRTDENGYFYFPSDAGPVLGNATITEISHPDFVDRQGISVVAGGDAGELLLEPLDGSISGRFDFVFGAGGPGSPPWPNPAAVVISVIDAPDGVTIDPSQIEITGWGQGAAGIWGNYEISDVPPGTYTIEARYDPGEFDVQTGFTPGEVTVTVAPNTDLDGADIELTEQGSIEGGIYSTTDPDFDPDLFSPTGLPGVEIRLLDLDGNLVRSLENFHSSTFRFDALDPGEYQIEAILDGHRQTHVPTATVGIGTTSPIDVVMLELSSITGILQGAPTEDQEWGNRLEGVTVTLEQFDADGNQLATMTTTTATPNTPGLDLGQFRFSNLDAAHRTEIRVELENYEDLFVVLADGIDPNADYQFAELGYGQDIDLEELVVEVLRSGIQGTVESDTGDSGAPDGLTITLIRLATNQQIQVGFDQDGNFLLENLFPGEYILEFNATDHAPKTLGSADAPIELQPDEIYDFGTVTLDQTFNRVQGTVNLRVGTLHLAEGNLDGTTVELYRTGQSQPTDSVLTNADGRFDFQDVPDGNYTLRATRDGYADISWPGNPFSVRNGATVERNAPSAMQAHNHDVTITVLSAVDDGPVAGIPVRLVRDPDVGTNPATARPATATNSSGVATFGALVPGQYRAEADGSNNPHQDGSVLFELEVADDPETDFEITIAEGLIDGTVEIDGAAASASGVVIRVYENDSGGLGDEVESFSMTGDDFEFYVPVGSFIAVADASALSGDYFDATSDPFTIASGDTHTVTPDPLVVQEAAQITLTLVEDRNGDTEVVPISGASIFLGDDEVGNTDGSGELDLLVRPGTYVYSAGQGANHDGDDFPSITVTAGGTGSETLAVAAYGELQVLTGQSAQIQVRLTPGYDGSANSVHTLSATTNPENRVITGVRTGTYDVEVCRTSFDNCDGSDSEDGVTISRGARRTINVDVS